MFKIIQWSTGNVGKGIIRSVAERDDMTLSGLYVFSEEKAGADAGELADIEPMGVTATTDVQSLLSSGADVMIHTSLPSLVYGDNLTADIDTFCQFLAAGINVVTTAGYMYPKVHGPEVADRIEAACQQGGSTFHSTGLNPGWMGDVLPLCMSSLSKSIQQIRVTEITNFQFYPSAEIMFGMMGFGKTDEEFERDVARYSHWLTGLFRENVQMIADGLNIPITEITDETERAYAPEDIEVAAGTLRKGSIAGQRWEWAGIANGKKAIVHETVWRMHHTVATDWPDGDHTIEIKGEPNMRLNVNGRWIDDGLLATGMHALNAVPDVCKADAGIKTLLDLPMILGKNLYQP